MVRRADQTYTGQALTVEFGDAAINATVNSSPPASQSIASASEPDAKLAQPKRPRKVNARRKLKSDQGSLF